MHSLIRAIALPLALMACVETDIDPQNPIDPMPIDECGAAELQGLVGQSARVLLTMRFGQNVRVIQPGTAVTMDFLPDRLNIWIAEGDVIERVTCG
jgi:hypothetical protein